MSKASDHKDSHATGDKGDPKEEQKDEVFQAVIIADPFLTKFRPLSIETPSVLFPLANVNTIEYTINFLNANKIKDIFIFAPCHKGKFEEYLGRIKVKGVNIKLLSSDDCQSLGDAIRELHSMGVIHGGFVLVYGDTVANFSLQQAFKEHVARRREAKSNIMTKIFKRLPVKSNLRNTVENAFVVVNRNNKQILQYQTVKDNDTFSITDRINFAEEKNNIQIRYDLQDTQVAICSPEVITHFVENFDYKEMRDELINDLLDSEITDDKIYLYELKQEEYCARVLDYRLYDVIARDVIQRWNWPFVLTNANLGLKEKTAYVAYPGNKYIDSSSLANISQTATISSNCAIGKQTKIEDGTKVTNSTIGRGCKIGASVVITNSYIWNNVTIEEGVVITNSIVANNAIIKKGAVVRSGSVVSYNVVVKEGGVVPEKTRLFVRKDGVAAPYCEKGSEFTDELNEWEFLGSKPNFLDKLFEDDEALEEGSDEEDGQNEQIDFTSEVAETMKLGIAKKHSLDNIIIEINSLKFAENKSFEDCIDGYLPVVLNELTKVETETPQELAVAIQNVLSRYNPLFKRFLLASQDALCFIGHIETFCKEHQKFYGCFHLFLQVLYKNETISEEFILDWEKARKESTQEEHIHYLKLCAKFLDWIRAQDEDEEEDEEEEEDEDEESQ